LPAPFTKFSLWQSLGKLFFTSQQWENGQDVEEVATF